MAAVSAPSPSSPAGPFTEEVGEVGPPPGEETSPRTARTATRVMTIGLRSRTVAPLGRAPAAGRSKGKLRLRDYAVSHRGASYFCKFSHLPGAAGQATGRSTEARVIVSKFS